MTASSSSGFQVFPREISPFAFYPHRPPPFHCRGVTEGGETIKRKNTGCPRQHLNPTLGLELRSSSSQEQ